MGAFSGGSFPVKNGSRNDLGIFATLDYSGLSDFDFIGGARLAAFSRNAVSDGVDMNKIFLGTGILFGHHPKDRSKA